MLRQTRLNISAGLGRELRILHLSDLHGARYGERQSGLARIAEEFRPDLIAITGDLIDATCDERAAEALLEAMTAAAPTYCVTGNHEAWEKTVGNPAYQRLMDAFERTGARLLRGETVEIGGVTLTGADDLLFEGGFHEYPAYLNRLGLQAGGEYRILLAHRPDMMEEYAQAGFDLTLTGHAHGGQIRLPLIGGLFAPGQGWFPKYTSGLYEHPCGGKMIVSRGLGNTVRVPRIFNDPEAGLITLM